MKKFLALSAATVLSAAPAAIAGPYVNVEANQKFDTGDYSSTLTEAHVGWESKLGKSSKFYIQGGPAVKLIDDGDNESLASGKVGIKSAVTERLSVYGEVKAYTGDEYNFDTLAVGVKSGIKYSF
jgi:outer membrane autotransporter protein